MLMNQIKIYFPSKDNRNKDIPHDKRGKVFNLVVKFIVDLNGWSTVINNTQCYWKNPENQLIEEKVDLIISSSNLPEKELSKKCQNICKIIKEELNQGSVMYEVNNKMMSV